MKITLKNTFKRVKKINPEARQMLQDYKDGYLTRAEFRREYWKIVK